MNYNLSYTEQAKVDLMRLLKDEPKSYCKAMSLIAEVCEHPRTGTGRPEQLQGEPHGRWSRRITRKHRLVYEIRDREVIVLVLTAYGHYDDK